MIRANLSSIGVLNFIISVFSKTSVIILTLVLTFFVSSFSYADDDEDAEMSIGDLANSFDFQMEGGMEARLSPYGVDLMGDMIDKNTGGISFEHTDISIPGNSNLEVALRRKIGQGQTPFTPYQQGFGDWEIDIPIAYAAFGSERQFGSTNYPKFNNGCLTNTGDFKRNLSVYGPNPSSSAIVFAEQHTDGLVLKVPGTGLSGFQGDFDKPADPKSNWVTGTQTSDHAGRCATVAVAPDGTKYKFGRHVFRKADAYKIPVSYRQNFKGNGIRTVHQQLYVHRRYAVYLITEVEDVHGNWVRYDYTNDDRAELTRIHSNDGRSIQLHYDRSYSVDLNGRNSQRVTHVTANGRRWDYDYLGQSQSTITYRRLRKVTLPDNRFWLFGDDDPIDVGLRAMSYEPHLYYKCLPFDVSFQIKHPGGAIGTFQLLETRHIKGATNLGSGDDASGHHMKAQNIPFVTNNYDCRGTRVNRNGSISDTQLQFRDDGHAHQRPEGWPIYRAMSVASKTISGVGLPTANWGFEYRNYDGGDLRDTWTKVTGPDGTKRTYTHRAIGKDYGLLKKVEVEGADGKTETMTYEHDYEEGGFGQLSIVDCKAGGIFGDFSGMCVAYRKRPVMLEVHKRDGDTFTTETNFSKNHANLFADYGRPNEVSRYSNISQTPRVRNVTYRHDTNTNIVGLVTEISQNGREMSTYDYDGKGQRTERARYGTVATTYEYNSDGTVKTVEDAIGRKIQLKQWKRGTAQEVVRSDGQSKFQYVDDDGWLTHTIDAMGNTTSYTYDTMGRLTQINPTGDFWANTDIDYNFPSNGGAVQTITKGRSKTTVTYDSMFRTTLEQTQALDTGWSSFVNTKYDALGRVIFQSQPSTNSVETKGVDTTYDGLGRVYDVKENVAPFAKTRHRYYRSHRHRVYDPSGAFTQYYSYGYGGPGNTDYRAIYSYANGAYQQFTHLYQNQWGQMTRLRQRGRHGDQSVNENQYFYYDANQRLCGHYVPEHGTTKYEYDAAGQMTGYAKGQPNSTCSAIDTATALVSQDYDALGRPTFTNFKDPATPDITKTYDDNGNVKTVFRGGVNWTYAYNDLNMLTSEKLDIDGRNYDSAYVYNASGFLTRKTQPNNQIINYTVDGLGRMSGVKDGTVTLASNASYHANGSVHQMSYGNGQYFSQTLNDRLLPERLLSYKGATKAIDQTLGYDARGLVTSIIDGAVSGNNRAYGYDGLGYLKTASGPWGAGSYKYDSLGNLREKKLGARTVALTYDTRNRLTRSADTGPSGTRTIAYDTRGNVTTLGNLAMAYDASDQPIAVTGTANGVGSANGTYRYDGNMKRVKSVVNGKTIYNVYDAGGALVHIDKASENKKTDYVSGPTGTLARITNGKVTYLHPDHLGSAQAGTKGKGYTKSTHGDILWREQYTPFGEQLQNPAANDNLDGFTGHIKDEDTGLNYMQARYYDPVIGRFLSIDPVTFGDTGNPSHFNRYAYANNDPINMIDPDGRQAAPQPNPPEPYRPNTRPNGPANSPANDNGRNGSRAGAAAGLGIAFAAGQRAGQAYNHNQAVDRINEDRGSYKAVGRFSHSDPSAPNASAPDGASWFPVEEMLGSDNPADTYGIPDGQLPGPGGSMTDVGGVNDRAFMTRGFIPKDIIGTPAVMPRAALPWPPRVSNPRLQGGGTEYIIPNRSVIQLKETRPTSGWAGVN